MVSGTETLPSGRSEELVREADVLSAHGDERWERARIDGCRYGHGELSCPIARTGGGCAVRRSNGMTPLCLGTSSHWYGGT